MSESTGKVPVEAFADLLERIADHSRIYTVTAMSFHFDGEGYRIAVEGDGELVLSDVPG